MSRYTDLLRDPFAPREYLITVEPHAIARGSMSVEAGGRYRSAGGLFAGLLIGDRLTAGGFTAGANNGAVTVTAADPAGTWIDTDRATVAEAAGARLVHGAVTRHFSTHGYTTGPAETPPNTWYADGVEVALRFTRSLYDGGTIGGRSIPGLGSIEINNTDGSRDHCRRWGWAGKRIRVELGGPDFARADYGLVFQGLTTGVEVTDELLRIAVTDYQALLDQALWSPVYAGTGAFEGGADLRGTVRPLAFGWVPHCAPQFVGIVAGRHTYQFHDGQVAPYDPNWHELYDQGVPLTYVAANPTAAQWTLDAAAGRVILGGSPAGKITLRTKGDATGGVFVETVADIIQRIATTRLRLDADLSVTSLTVGTGARTFTTRATLPLAVGGTVLIARRDDGDSVWMLGTVTGWDASTGAATVNVARASGTGTYADWSVTRIGLTPAELDGASFAALNGKNSAPVGLSIADETVALDHFDNLAASIGAHYGFTRPGLLQLGRYEPPAGTPALVLDGMDVLELSREPTEAPVWSVMLGFAPNFAVLSESDLASGVKGNAVTNGTFDAATGWTFGAGWSHNAAAFRAEAAAASSDLSRTVNLSVGMRYQLRAEITVTSGSVQPKVGGVAVGPAVAASVTIEVEFTAGAAAPTLAFTGSAFTGWVDSVSIVSAKLAFFGTASRYTAPKSDGQIRTIYGPTAPELVRETLLRDAAAAEAERDRLAALFGASADIFRVTAKTEPFTLDVGAEVSLADARYGLAAGFPSRALSIEEDAGDNRIELLLRG